MLTVGKFAFNRVHAGILPTYPRHILEYRIFLLFFKGFWKGDDTRTGFLIIDVLESSRVERKFWKGMNLSTLKDTYHIEIRS